MIIGRTANVGELPEGANVNLMMLPVLHVFTGEEGESRIWEEAKSVKRGEGQREMERI